MGYCNCLIVQVLLNTGSLVNAGICVMYSGEVRPVLAYTRQRVVWTSARDSGRCRRTGYLHHPNISARHGETSRSLLENSTSTHDCRGVVPQPSNGLLQQ